jgi:hypothetical protein
LIASHNNTAVIFVATANVSYYRNVSFYNPFTMATGGINLSKEFFELLKAIGESKSKQEEDRIIAKEVQCLKQKLEPTPTGVTPPLQSKKRAKEFLVRYDFPMHMMLLFQLLHFLHKDLFVIYV